MEYSGTSEEGHRIADRVAIGWLGNPRIVDPLWKNMLQNAAEFYCVEAEVHGYEHQFYDNNPAELCKKAQEAGCSHVLICKIGLFPQQLFDKFTEWFENYYNGEVFVGHVLDKGDLYYEIHPQCMFVDVAWFNTRCGEFSQRFRGRKWKTAEPIRSEENFHDQYTPKWVRGVGEQKEYEGSCWGYNVVEAGLQHKNGIGIWPEKIRQSYHYAYGEVLDDYVGKKARILGALQNKESFFIANTEDFVLPENPPEVDPNIRRRIFCTSGGLMAPFLAYNLLGRVTADQHIIIIDRSGIAIGLSDIIFNKFKPTKKSYEEWCSDFFGEHKWLRKLIQGKHRLKAMSDYIEYHEGFKDYFEDLYNFVPRDYEEIDLFEVDDFKRVLERYAFKEARKEVDEKYEVYINLSNVFHYYQSSVFFNVKERQAIKEEIEQYLRDIQEELTNVKLYIIGPGGQFEYNGYIPFSMEGAEKAREIFPWT